MTRPSLVLSLIAIALLASGVSAQEMSFPTPGPKHKWLEQFVGEWTSISKTTETPDQPSMEFSGSISSRKLGGFWVVNEIKGDAIDGTTFNGLQTIGYDTTKQKIRGHMGRFDDESPLEL